MSETKPIYSGEAVLRGRGESDRAGMWVRLELEDAGGVHPFKGFEGERFAVVIVGPLASAEHELPEQTRVGPASGGKSGQGLQKNVSEDSGRSTTKRRWQDMPASQRAALRVQDREFWKYITEARGEPCFTEATADAWLKKHLDVDSKSKITGPVAYHFDLLDGKFHAWSQARGHGVV